MLLRTRVLREGVPGGGFDSAQGDEQAGNKEILKMVTGSGTVHVWLHRPLIHYDE
jgi:hypothetical protein